MFLIFICIFQSKKILYKIKGRNAKIQNMNFEHKNADYRLEPYLQYFLLGSYQVSE